MCADGQSSAEVYKPRIVAAIPCFNEERFIGSVVAKARNYADTVVVIDDGSTDDSARIADTAGAQVYRHEHNRGYGAAIDSAFEKARELKAGILVILDGDGQHDPKEIPNLVQPIVTGQADVVIGSRFLDKKNKSPFYRRVGQRILTTATNVGSGQKISDSQSGFRAYSSKALSEICVAEDGMAVSSEMQFAIKEANLKVCEIPIDVSYDEGSKRNPVLHGINVLTRVLVLFILRHPILLFGVPGIAFMLAGLIIGIDRVVLIYDRTGELAVGYALISILLGSAGFLGIYGALMLQAMKELLRGETSQLVKKIRRDR